jgi:hypothetical protein
MQQKPSIRLEIETPGLSPRFVLYAITGGSHRRVTAASRSKSWEFRPCYRFLPSTFVLMDLLTLSVRPGSLRVFRIG